MGRENHALVTSGRCLHHDDLDHDDHLEDDDHLDHDEWMTNKFVRKLKVVHKEVGDCLISYNLQLAYVRRLEVI